MTGWIQRYRSASRETKYFVLNVVAYGLLLVFTTIYCYARLDYVRSYAAPIPVFNTTTPKVPHTS